MTKSLNRRMAAGALWMALLRLADRTVGLISLLIMARLLVPEDYGLVAMATSVIAFLELATAFSFDVQLIQKQDAARGHFDTAWTLNVVFYTALTIVLLALAKPAATFYQEPRLTAVICVLSAGFFLKGLENNGIVLFRKELDFRKDFFLMFSRKVAGFVIAVPFAVYLRSYWALIFGMIATNVVGLVMSYLLHPFRPRLRLSHAREMLHFSKWLVANNLVNFLRLRSPDFVIGRISGGAALGLFSIAQEIATLPTTEIVAPINRAVFPGYSKIANNFDALRESYLNVLGIIAFAALPAGIGISIIADPLVRLALGSEWIAAIPLVSVLALYGAVNAIRTNSWAVFYALGKPRLITFIDTSCVVLLLALSIPLALSFGAMGVAVAFVAAYCIILPITFYYVCREIELSGSSLLSILWRPALSAAIMAVVTTKLNLLVSSHVELNAAVAIAILVPAGAITYLLSAAVLWIGAGRPNSPEYRLLMAGLRKVRTSKAEAAPT